MPNYLDLFAGAGGLSEGFIQAGFTPVAHVEMDDAACFTLKTRAAYHWLRAHDGVNIYNQYQAGEITRRELYAAVPQNVLDTVLNYEISDDSLDEIFDKIDEILEGEHLDLIVGGPPCQAYSVVGRARSGNNMVGDHRNYLYRLYARFLTRYHPEYFVFENVVGLKSAKEQDGTYHFDNMRQLFRECGYSTQYRVLNAKDYGVLQNRRRIILIGKHGDQEEHFYPEIPDAGFDNVMVSEVFRDLPPLQAGEGSYYSTVTLPYNGEYLYNVSIKEYNQQPVTFHISRPHTEQDRSIYRIVVNKWNEKHERVEYTELPDKLKTHNNRSSFLDRFKVVAGDLPFSQTVVAHVSRDGHYYIHPDVEQNRSLTPREVARLQTFPDDYFFESQKGRPGRTAAYRQIGNAVPVRLAYCVAMAMLGLLDQ